MVYDFLIPRSSGEVDLLEVQGRITRPWSQPGKMAAEEWELSCAHGMRRSSQVAQRFLSPAGAPGQVTDGRAVRWKPPARGPQQLSAGCACKRTCLVQI